MTFDEIVADLMGKGFTRAESEDAASFQLDGPDHVGIVELDDE